MTTTTTAAPPALAWGVFYARTRARGGRDPFKLVARATSESGGWQVALGLMGEPPYVGGDWSVSRLPADPAGVTQEQPGIPGTA